MVPKRWTSDVPSESWSDERLVTECLNGNEDAWAALIENGLEIDRDTHVGFTGSTNSKPLYVLRLP